MDPELQSKSFIFFETPPRATIPYDSERTTERALSSEGELIGRKVDEVAMKYDWGLIGAMQRILSILDKGNTREQVVEEIYISLKENQDSGHKISNLRKECLVIMKYTLPSESLHTQLEAFKGIASLTTRYPYLRNFFHSFKHLEAATDKKTAALGLWKRTNNPDDKEWRFFRQMAATCISDEDVTAMVEAVPPSEMGLILDSVGGLIQNLLRVINSSEYYKIPCAISTRYLGGILESSPFWKEIGGAPHHYIAQTLFTATKHLLEDIGVECKVQSDPKTEIFSDIESVDILTHAVLAGVKVWLELDPTRRLEHQYWSAEFTALFELVILKGARSLLPKSRKQVIEEYAWLIKSYPQYQEKHVNKSEALKEGQNQSLESLYEEQPHDAEFAEEEKIPPGEALDLTGQVSGPTRRPLFEGTYSSIYKGYYGGYEVAVKSIRTVKDAQSMRFKIREATEGWWYIRHPNVLGCFGYAEDSGFGYFGAIISPWCDNGNSLSYLAQGRSVTERVKMFFEVAKGLQYLHQPEVGIVHGDLKPVNILIDNEEIAKIADYDLITRITQDDFVSGKTITPAYTNTVRYLPYELVEDEQHPAKAGDVYALGCIGHEFIYSQTPYTHIHNGHANAHYKICKAIGRGVPAATRPSNISAAVSGLWDVLEACWDNGPEKRPEAGDVVRYLEQHGQAVSDILKL